MIGRVPGLLLASALCLVAAGCRHTAQPLVIPPPAPVAVANPTVPPGQLPTESAGTVPLGTVPVVPAVPAKRVRKKVAPAAPVAPVEVASAAPPPPPPVEIGALTTEGASTGNRKAAGDLLAANEKRLAGLTAAIKDKQKDQVARVMSFQGDGMKALRSGDADAAMTLATKAKVLLDEMTK